MDQVLRDLPFCRCYIDDIITWSRNVEEHVQHLGMVFQRLREAGLKVHPGKCVFGADSIDFLGHRISVNKLEPQQDKIAAVRDLPAPTNLDRGHATNTKVQLSHFVTVIRDILNHESDEHDKLGEILLGSATLW